MREDGVDARLESRILSAGSPELEKASSDLSDKEAELS